MSPTGSPILQTWIFSGEEELQLAQQREFLGAGQTSKQAAASQLTLLRASARLDDSPEAQWDWTITAAGGSETALTVIAPRSFTYLRRLAGVDCEGLLTELLQTNVGGLRVAAKSGSSLLCSSDNRTFVLKTISRSEVKQVRAMLAAYRKHLEEYPDSLLCRIYGCFSFKNSLGYFLHAVLMDCLVGLPASIAGFDYLTPRIFDIKSEFLGSWKWLDQMFLLRVFIHCVPHSLCSYDSSCRSCRAVVVCL